MNNNDRKLNIDDEVFEEIKPTKKKWGRHKKTMYVPDEELLNYSRSKNKEESPAEETVNDTVIEDVEKVAQDTVEETIIQESIVEEALTEETTEIVKETEETSADTITETEITEVAEKKAKKPFSRKKKTILTIVSIISAVVLVSSLGYLAWYFWDLNQQNKKLEFIQSVYDTNRDDYTYNQDGEFSKFDELKKQNSDIKGWLSIDKTELDNPVYQTTDNDFYITHDMNKEKNSYGALFLDFRCNVNPLTISQNQIIYGHNMRYGAMFGTLREYRNLDFYKAHPTVNFDSLYESRKYKIVAIMVCDSGVDSAFGYDFTPYTPDFATQEEFLLWIERCRVRSLINTNVDVKAQDEVITLSTCCYDFDDARLVIVARLLREGESAEVDTSQATVNSKVIYPGKYYAKRNMAIPQVEPPKITIYDK